MRGVDTAAAHASLFLMAERNTTLTSFSRTMRALDADGMSPALLASSSSPGSAACGRSWLVVARVPVYQISEAARLEVERVHPIAAPVVGRVVVDVAGARPRRCNEGDVLLEVEAERERLETAEERTRLASVASELELQREIRRRGSRRSTRRARGLAAALAEAAQRLSVAEAAAVMREEKVPARTQLER